ncbi:MAG: 3-hydroxyacyl-CoA dehydrogenase/enoyl-CoA hydratase family protein [Acidobacteriota bacterium]
MRQFQKLAVVGAGNMGSGIAQKMATEGFAVLLVDIDEERVGRGLTTIDRMLAEAVERRVMRADRTTAIRRLIQGTTRLDDVADASLVVEAVFEDRALKQDVFRRLDAVCGPDTILATNTSSYLVSEIAAVVRHPSRVLGLHYFFHPAKNHLVEVIPGAATDPAVFRRAWSLQEQLRKIPIASRDAYGFIVNRFFVVWLVEAVRMLEEGLANAATIDAIANQTFGTAMGPFELMNVTGVPIAFHASTTIGQAYGPMYAPPARLRTQTEIGEPWPLTGAVDPAVAEGVAGRLLAITFLVAATLVDEEIGTKEDTDIGARVGLRWPAGPFALMNRYGTARSLEAAAALAARWGLPVPPSLADAGRANRPFALALVRSDGPAKAEGGHDAPRADAPGGITTITIDRPDAMNALDETVIAQLREAFQRAAADPATSGIVIAGAGRSFVAGADLRFFIRHIESGDLERIVRFTGQCQALLLEIQHCAKPVVARLHGLALGGGVELALACDYIVAAPGASLGFPETGIGIYPGLGGTQRTTRRIGTGLTKWLVLTGRIVPGEEAASIGLIDRVAPYEELDSAIAELIEDGVSAERRPGPVGPAHRPLAEFFDIHDVEQIRTGRAETGGDERLAAAMKAVGEKAPIAVRLAAALIDEGAAVPLEDGLRMELAHLLEIFRSQDALAGLRSVGKSRPVFEGR